MKLDRNKNGDGKGKYALIKLREVELPFTTVIGEGGIPCALVPVGAIDFGNMPDTDFFVIRLKDKYAYEALAAYANAVRRSGDDDEYAMEIGELADRARAGSRPPD